MATKILDYKKISELPSVQEVADNDVLVLNHNGITSKISFADLMTIINSKVTHDLSELTQRIESVENTTSTLATTVSEDNATINNIITAGFNLIGIDN